MATPITLDEITRLPLRERPAAARIWLEREVALCPIDPRDRVTLPGSTRHPLEQILDIPRRDRPIAVRAWIAQQEEQVAHVEEQSAPAAEQESFDAEEGACAIEESPPDWLVGRPEYVSRMILSAAPEAALPPPAQAEQPAAASQSATPAHARTESSTSTAVHTPFPIHSSASPPVRMPVRRPQGVPASAGFFRSLPARMPVMRQPLIHAPAVLLTPRRAWSHARAGPAPAPYDSLSNSTPPQFRNRDVDPDRDAPGDRTRDP